MKRKIGLIGYLGYSIKDPIIGGQMNKTRGIYKELLNYYGEDLIEIIDTSNWKNEKGKLFTKCIKMAKDCSFIIILPNKNGIKFILPFFAMLKPVMRYKIAFPVVGGWLTELLEKYGYLAKSIKAVDYILPETKALKKELEHYVSCKMDVMPIFSTRKMLNEDEIPREFEKPYRFCTFSRVIPEKGIDPHRGFAGELRF